MLTHYEQSTGTYTVTLTDANGAAVTGATVTLTVKQAGTAISGDTWPASMTDNDDGTYSYTIAASLLSRGRRYYFETTAVKGAAQRFAAPEVNVTTDRT